MSVQPLFAEHATATLQKLSSLDFDLPSELEADAPPEARGFERDEVLSQAGTPFSVFCGADFTSGCDYNADGTNNDRPDVIGGIPSSGFSENQFLNTGVFGCTEARCGNLFPAPAPGRLGTLGRNTFVGPGYINTDFSAIKRTHIPWFVAEGAQLEFRAEFFNVFNHVNLTGVNSDINGGAFGLASGAFPARDIQFGIRIEF